MKQSLNIKNGRRAWLIERKFVRFQRRTRANDEGEQMRVIAAEFTPSEIRDLSHALSGSSGR